MSSSTSHSTAQKRGAHGGGGGSHHGGDDDGGGGGGGGDGGKLVKVAFARTQPEAEMMQGLLSESGIPSVLKRSRGFEIPEFLAAGPHDVFVQAEVARRARDLLTETMLDSEEEWEETPPARLALWVGAAFLGAVILVWVLYEVSGG